MQVDNMQDTASLDFESILENDINQIADVNSNDGSGGNGFLFDQTDENYDVPRGNNNDAPGAYYENTDHQRSTFFGRNEREKMEFLSKTPSFSQPKNELADNVLFNKFRESADNATQLNEAAGQSTVQSTNETTSDDNQNGKLKDSNSVSCEDLLEFADKKPKGKERGIESDEVRIMTKVLGTVVSYLKKTQKMLQKLFINFLFFF